jgi:hypothetical protein
MRTSLFAAILAAALAAPAAADRAEDDLQVVRKAVASASASAVRPPAEAPPSASADPRPEPRKAEPRWLHVRVVGKGSRHARVSIDLPLGLARSLGDEWPLAPGRCRRDRCQTLGEVLRSLASGQSLVEIESDEATARVWVE